MILKKTTLALASAMTLASAAHAQSAAPDAVRAEVTMAPHYTLSWPAGLGPVDIYAAPAPDQSKMTLIRHDVTATSLSLASPLSGTNRAYFYLKPRKGGAGLWVSNRVLPLEGVANFRDMGGYETTDHHHVRWDVFYRSAAPSGLTQADYALVDTLGIKSVTDLRTQAEQEKQPTHWQGASPAFFASEKPTLPADMTDRTHLATMGEAQARALMEGFYAKMPDYYAPELKALFARLLAHQTPTLTHCTAGKDRTGFASALILYALGVPEQTILTDYAMSGDLLRAHMTPSFKAAMADQKNGGAMAASPSMRAMLDSDPAYLKAAFDSIKKQYGSVDAYLAQKLDVGPQRLTTLRRLYLD
ncbi:MULTISPECIES: tyrosine-protein phosphatase [Asaia]|uniref:tyrosine-protein phosphatase n=1 Tax=Asaia TaxID=91914 RepID=UPI002FC34757